jgi:exodeoxyribonuclease VII small subunit
MTKKSIEADIPANFEHAISLLEQIIAEIENDDVKLEVALEKYQNGMGLVKYCQDKLVEVEQKIKILDIDNNTLKDLIVD